MTRQGLRTMFWPVLLLSMIVSVAVASQGPPPPATTTENDHFPEGYLIENEDGSITYIPEKDSDPHVLENRDELIDLANPDQFYGTNVDWDNLFTGFRFGFGGGGNANNDNENNNDNRQQQQQQKQVVRTQRDRDTQYASPADRVFDNFDSFDFDFDFDWGGTPGTGSGKTPGTGSGNNQGKNDRGPGNNNNRNRGNDERGSNLGSPPGQLFDKDAFDFDFDFDWGQPPGTGGGGGGVGNNKKNKEEEDASDKKNAETTPVRSSPNKIANDWKCRSRLFRFLLRPGDCGDNRRRRRRTLLRGSP